MNLFRQDVFDHQAAEREGKPLVVSPLSFRLIAGGVAAFLLGFGCLLFWGTYTNQQTVNGYLLPSRGLATVHSPKQGMVRARYVKLGDQVHKGQKLYKIEVRQSTSHTADVNAVLRHKYASELSDVADRMHLAKQHEASSIAGLKNKREGLRQQLQALRSHLKTEQALYKLAQKNVARYRPMASQGIVSGLKLQQQLAMELSDKAAIEQLHQDEASLESQIKAFPEKLADVHSETADRIARLRDQASQLQRQQLQTEANSEFVIRAPVTGVISSIMGQEGESVDASTPLASILPRGSKLEARLLIPSKAVGQIHVGQTVRLRYSAFPYQQFGLYVGRLTSLSRSIMVPSELSLPVSMHEPYYMATVTLAEPYVLAHGKHLPLAAGMTLTANIVLGQQHLYQWILRPLASLRGST